MALTKVRLGGLEPQYVGRRNLIINGAFQVAQRGTSATGSGYTTVDRWKFPLSDQASAVVANDRDTSIANMLKVTSSTSSAGYGIIVQPIEDVRTGSGKNVTLSFYAKTSDFSNFRLEIQQIFGSGGSATVTVLNNTSYFTVPDSGWNQYTATISLPSVSGKTLGTGHYLNILFGPNSGTAGGITYYSEVQLEVGQATPFEHRSFGEELASCQRYYQKSYADNVAPSTVTNNGAFWTNIIRNASNQNYWHVQTYQTMRSQPSVTTHSPATGTSGKFENDTDGADRDSAVSNTSNTGFSIRPNSGTSNDLGDVVAVHWVADSEL